jgi:transposase
MHQSTVSRVLRRFHETGEYSRRPGQGRRRTTIAQRDRFLLLQSLRHRTLTAPALQVYEDINSKLVQILLEEDLLNTI